MEDFSFSELEEDEDFHSINREALDEDCGKGNSSDDGSDKFGEQNCSGTFMFLPVPEPTTPVYVSRKLSYKSPRYGM